MESDRIIGVIGGMGPYAGLDLVRKIFDQTQAHTDQEHVPVALLSYPHRIGDRSRYLAGDIDDNPAHAIADIACQLERLGAIVAGMPCNTAHIPAIYDAITERLTDRRIRLLHMIDETAAFVTTALPRVQRVGILSTTATYRFRLYPNALEAAGVPICVPDERVQDEKVNRAIYDPNYGIKAQSNPVSQVARQHVLDAIEHLQAQGAEAVILGCTELPLAVPERYIDTVMLIDPTWVLARALLRATYPERVRPLQD